MRKFKNNWEITQNWQLLHPVIGILLSLGCGMLIGSRIIASLTLGQIEYYSVLVILSLILTYAIIKLSLYFFDKLKNKWKVNARWQFIAIFIVFAITGSAAGRLSSPLMEAIGLSHEEISSWLYWPIRILIIFPIYQALLLCIGWLFGQFSFFYAFEKKMLSRFGLGFLFSK
ncbi:MAG: DUF6787 family protein [Leeuwenhoekiella sp.]